MSYTGTTDKLKLPQFINTDTFNICGDLNGAFKKIDDNAIENANEISLLKTNEGNNATGLQELNNTITELRGDVQTISETLGATNETITTLNRHLNDLETEIELLQGLNISENLTSLEGRLSNVETEKLSGITIKANESFNFSSTRFIDATAIDVGDLHGTTFFQFDILLPSNIYVQQWTEMNVILNLVNNKQVIGYRAYQDVNDIYRVHVKGSYYGDDPNDRNITSIDGTVYYKRFVQSMK